jgi:hypothetical protein
MPSKLNLGSKISGEFWQQKNNIDKLLSER